MNGMDFNVWLGQVEEWIGLLIIGLIATGMVGGFCWFVYSGVAHIFCD